MDWSRYALQLAWLLTDVQETRLREIIHELLEFPFQLQFVYFSGEIPHGSGGKFEEFNLRGKLKQFTHITSICNQNICSR